MSRRSDMRKNSKKIQSNMNTQRGNLLLNLEMKGIENDFMRY